MRKLKTVTIDDSECLAVHTASVSPRGDVVVGGGGAMGQPGWVGVWDARSCNRRSVWSAGATAIANVAVSGDQRWLATACHVTDSIELWELATSQHDGTLKLFSPPYRRNAAGLTQSSTHVTMIAFSHDDRLLAAGCWDMSAKIWDLESRSMTELFRPHQSNVDFVAFRPCDHSLVSGTYQSLFVWNAVSGTCKQKIDLPADDVWQHCFLEAHDQIASISRSGTIRLWNPGDWSFRESHVELNRAVTSLARSSRLNQLAIGLATGVVVFVDTVEGRLLRRWKISGDPIDSLSYAPFEDTIWSVTAAGRNRLQLHTFSITGSSLAGGY